MTVLVSAVMLSALVTWFGFGVGLLVRNSPTTVSLLLLWPLLIEGLISVFLNLLNWEGAVKYLPYHAAISASVGNPDTDELGRPEARSCSPASASPSWLSASGSTAAATRKPASCRAQSPVRATERDMKPFR